MRRKLLALPMVLTSLAVAASICLFLNSNSVFAQETQPELSQQQVQAGQQVAAEQQVQADHQVAADQQVQADQQDPASQGDTEDVERVRKFAERLPPFMRNAVMPGRGAPRPMLAFRHWSHERKPFVGTFLFCLFIGLVGSAFFPKQIAVAQESCRKQFWRCLGRAILIFITILFSVRMFTLMVVTQPLATLLIGVLQLIILAGLSVGIWLIGERIVVRTKLENTEFFKAHPKISSFVKIFIGSLCIALIVQIPGFGLLPRIGIRTAMLIATLGAGGLLRTKFGTQPVSVE